MASLIRAQLIVLRRRPLLWGLAAGYLLLLVAQLLASAMLLNSLDQLNSFSTPGAGEPLPPEMERQLRLQALLPGSLAAVFSHINGVGGLLLMIFSAAFVGADYSWGTLRTQLARQPNRVRWLLAKIGVLLILSALMVLVTLIVGAPLALINHAILDQPITGGVDVGAVVLGALRSWYGLIPYQLLAVASAVAGRSALSGIIGSLMLWATEQGLGLVTLFRVAGTLGKQLYDALPGQNVGALTDQTRRSFGLALQGGVAGVDVSFPPVWRAAIMLLIYSLIFGALALALIRRRDIGGPA